MEIRPRMKDTSQIIESQWQANHSYENIKKESNDRNDFYHKLNGTKDIKKENEERKKKLLETYSMGGQIRKLETNMNAVNEANRIGKMNDIKSKF